MELIRFRINCGIALFVGQPIMLAGLAPCTIHSQRNLIKQRTLDKQGLAPTHTGAYTHTHAHPHVRPHLNNIYLSIFTYSIWRRIIAKYPPDHIYIHQLQMMPISRLRNVLSSRGMRSQEFENLLYISSYIAGRRHPNNISFKFRINYAYRILRSFNLDIS